MEGFAGVRTRPTKLVAKLRGRRGGKQAPLPCKWFKGSEDSVYVRILYLAQKRVFDDVLSKADTKGMKLSQTAPPQRRSS